VNRHQVSTVLELQELVKNGSTVIPICLWRLHVQVMKLLLTPYASCATMCYQNTSKLCKLEALTNCQSIMVKSSQTDNENATVASCRVSCLISLAGEAHAVVETLIKPCAVEMATCVLGEQSKKKFDTVLLSDNSVKRRIEGMSADVEKNRCRDLNPALLFRCNLTNQQTCQD
jgi:hypothetical protein